MKQQHRRPGAWPAFVLSTLTLSISSTLYAAEAEGDTKKDQEEAESVVVVGSRAAPRSVTESSTPVDLISSKELDRSGASNMSDLIAGAVPSFNVNTQPISDAATLVRPANMRGLPPDNTLVLVNGKRRHRSSVITFLGGGLSDGSHGPDLGVIPTNALKQVEILRDGAAAIYGSDAIAGVINFVLKDDASGGSVGLRWGEYFEGDGDSLRLSANAGFAPTDSSFFNISAEFKENDATDRSIQRDDAQALIDAGNTNVPNPAQIWGSPEVKDDYTVFFNSGFDIGANAQLYAFGNLSSRDVEGGFYYRNPVGRTGVYVHPSDNSQFLVGDMTPNDGISCPTVSFDSNGLPNAAELAVIAADDNCWSFYERFPGGFTPRFGGTVKDQSLVVGFSGEFSSGGWAYDFSATHGQNEAEFLIFNTVNPSMGSDSPTSFNPGGYVQTEKYLNADFTREYSGFNIATGLEVRNEEYETKQGDEASWTIGVLADPETDLGWQGYGIGSNGFPGFAPRMAGSWDRSSWAAYVDMEKDIADVVTTTLAVRTEDYEDFGSTFDYKLSTLIHLTDSWALRSSLATGFRAPTVGQSHVLNVTTQFTPGIGLNDQATLPPTHPISVLKGGKTLQPEESNSQTFGFVAELDDLYITADFYEIEVYNRIAQVSAQTLSAADIAALLAAGVSDAASFTSITYFANEFDTTTKGLDLVVNYSTEWFDSPTKLAFLANYTETTLDEYNPTVISHTRLRQIEEGLPKVRGSFSVNQKYGDAFSAMYRINYFGSYWEAHLDDETLPIDAGAEFTIDVEFAYDMNDAMQVKFGVQNLLDEYPVENKEWGSSVAGAKYPPTSPMGFNGGFYYLEANYNW